MIHLKRLGFGSVILIPFVWAFLFWSAPITMGIITAIGIVYLVGYSISRDN